MIFDINAWISVDIISKSVSSRGYSTYYTMTREYIVQGDVIVARFRGERKYFPTSEVTKERRGKESFQEER